MAADVSIAADSSNPCCAELREKYQKMEKKRNALKEAVNLLERQIYKIETEKNNLKKAFKEEKKRGDSEREVKDKEIIVRKTLENELRELKAQVSFLSQETKTIDPSEKAGEEIERLKRLLEEEKKISLSEKKKAMEAWNLLKLEKGKVEKERKKANEFRVSFDELKCDFEGVKDQFVKALEEEKRKASREKRLADAEKMKLEEQKKILEREKKNAIDEKKGADVLLKKLEEERERNKNLQSKIASQNTRKEKIQIDNLLKKLEDERDRNKILQTNIASENTQKGILKKLQKEREKNKKLKAKIEALTSAQSAGILVNNGNLKVKFLKEKLKFRKEKLKHVKNVLKLEKSKNSLIKQHFSMLKQDFLQLINRFKLIDMHLGFEGTNHLAKVSPAIGLETPVEQISRKSESIPASGTSSESIPTNGQNNYKHFTDKKILLGPQERERASSVSSQIHKTSGGSLQNSLDPLKASRKRKRNENNLDSKKKEKKIQNVNNNTLSSDFVEFEKRVRNGGVLKLLEFENEEMERRFRNAIERPLSPNLPQIAPRKIIKESFKENHECFLVRDLVQNENLMPKLDVFELEIGSNLSEFNSSLDLMEIVTVDEEKGSCENSEGVNEKQDIFEGQSEKCAILDYLVVFSILKEESLERVKNVWENMNFDESCKVGLDSRVLEVASKSELLSEERACIIYSLLASNICGMLVQKAKNITDGDFASYIRSFRDGIYAVMSEETLKLLAENNILEKILSLMEDFIIHKKVLALKNGELCSDTPTKDQFISNYIILASLCLKINRLDITLAAAYKILLEGKTDVSQTLLSVHVLIYICRERLFCTNQEQFLSRAVQWVVFRLEKYGTSKNLGFFRCQKCPFEMDQSNMESFVDSILDEVEMCLMRNPNPNFACSESCSVYKAERNGLCYFTEVVSLVELVAIYMDWKDVYDKVVARVLKILESCKNEEFSAALLVLIGHLARFGVDNLGYEEMQVSELRNKLSNIIKTNEQSGLPLQFASVGVLVNLIPFNFREVVTGEDASISDKDLFSSVIGQIRSWFSHLNEEQKAVSHSLFIGF